ncbi:response regulator transcription factor [uncultured Robinsoniella sp.]|uniref:response regulator transcription factor n=1 Tax=uncultured Robinsoniella sp. TaxID=904190 RepID=UPI00374EF7CD
MRKRILLADDEREIIELLRLYLEKDGYDVLAVGDGLSALQILRREKVDLAMVDIMMPNLNGYELIKAIRKEKNLPIIVISAKGETADKILGLGLGADDYIVKPFDPLEVVARVDANIRRFYCLSQSDGDEPLKVHDLELDLQQCTLSRGKQTVELTSIEFKILKLFMGTPGRVFTKKQIYEAAWEEQYIVDDNNIMVYISKIRDKIGERNGESYIRTIRGLGYKMIAD